MFGTTIIAGLLREVADPRSGQFHRRIAILFHSAKRLVDEVGSVERAKEAIDVLERLG
jgi:hypothetical protein